MGFFDKIKNALGDKAADKIRGKQTSGSYSSGSGSSYTPQHDAAHEAQVEKMRKENELRALEMERQMQDSAAKIMSSQVELMDAATETLKEQSKQNKKK